jgi:hypothetical protein
MPFSERGVGVAISDDFRSNLVPFAERSEAVAILDDFRSDLFKFCAFCGAKQGGREVP